MPAKSVDNIKPHVISNLQQQYVWPAYTMIPQNILIKGMAGVGVGVETEINSSPVTG